MSDVPAVRAPAAHRPAVSQDRRLLFQCRGPRAPVTETDREQAHTALLISSYGGFLVAQAAAQRMLPHGAGTILLTGASASVKGYPLSAVFAMGKFALRGLMQSIIAAWQTADVGRKNAIGLAHV